MELRFSSHLYDVNPTSQWMNFIESPSLSEKTCCQETAKYFNGFTPHFRFDDRANILEGKFVLLMLFRSR